MQLVDLPDHAYWSSGFPRTGSRRCASRSGSRSTCSSSCPSRSRPGAVSQGARLREDARREGPRDAQLVGNTIDAPDAFARMGADVMRWQYCSQPPNQNLLFGFGPAHEIQRRLLTLWNSCKFLVDYAKSTAGSPSGPISRAARTRSSSRSTAGSCNERTRSSARPPRPMRAGSRWTSSVPTRPSSTTSRTGTSGARGAGSGTATPSLFGRLVRARPGASRRRPAHAVPHGSVWRVLTAPCAEAPASVHLAGRPRLEVLRTASGWTSGASRRSRRGTESVGNRVRVKVVKNKVVRRSASPSST